MTPEGFGVITEETRRELLICVVTREDNNVWGGRGGQDGAQQGWEGGRGCFFEE